MCNTLKACFNVHCSKIEAEDIPCNAKKASSQAVRRVELGPREGAMHEALLGLRLRAVPHGRGVGRPSDVSAGASHAILERIVPLVVVHLG